MSRVPCFQTEGARILITLEQQLRELRAELLGCRMTRRERVETEAERAKAIAQLAEFDRQWGDAAAGNIKGRGE